LVNGTVVVNIDRECTHSPENAMDDGTFVALCRNPQVFLRNNDGFARSLGRLVGASLTIISENAESADRIDWLVVAERQDTVVRQWDRTDADGYLVTQYLR